MRPTELAEQILRQVPVWISRGILQFCSLSWNLPVDQAQASPMEERQRYLLKADVFVLLGFYNKDTTDWVALKTSCISCSSGCWKSEVMVPAWLVLVQCLFLVWQIAICLLCSHMAKTRELLCLLLRHESHSHSWPNYLLTVPPPNTCHIRF